MPGCILAGRLPGAAAAETGGVAAGHGGFIGDPPGVPAVGIPNGPAASICVT